MGIGQNIAYYRKKAGLTQKDLAWKVGINKSYLSAIENGHLKPHFKIIVQIADCLKITMESLLREETEG